MFTAEEIQARLRQQPFKPVRIVVSEGLHFDIYHPELVLVGRRDLSIGKPDPANPTIYAGLTRVALVHVVALDELAAASSPLSNGPSS